MLSAKIPFAVLVNRKYNNLKYIIQEAPFCLLEEKWKEKNIFLILCGSIVSFMENEVMGEDMAAAEIMEPENLFHYMGHIFEGICTEYMIRKAKARGLLFIPAHIGRW